jgi:hypothetical protein
MIQGLMAFAKNLASMAKHARPFVTGRLPHFQSDGVVEMFRVCIKDKILAVVLVVLVVTASKRHAR